MGTAQAKLSEQSEIIDLLRILEQSKLMKERQEVESLVNYLDNMESQFGEVLKELKEVKGQLTQIQDKGVKASVRDKTIGELYSGTYVVYANMKVKDFMIFWLEKEMRPRITSDSYGTYSNIVYNHIIPAIGKMKMTEIKRSHVQTLYNEEAAVSVSVEK